MRYREIELTQDKWTIIDALDYDLVAPFSWYAQLRRGLWYVVSRRVGLPSLHMHRLISLPPAYMEVDHINGDGLFNSRANLRWATHAQNVANADMPQGENGSGYRGVIANRDGWQARISVNGRRISLGTYYTREDAARAYDEAAKIHHGAFARLNFVE